MSKVFQILNGFCYCDMTPQFPDIYSTKGRFAPDVHIIETPDFVQEGWGYDETKEGNERFIQPTPPEGWLYDPHTNVFYPEDENPPSPLTPEERIAALEAQLAELLNMKK